MKLYSTIVADPPWPYDPGPKENGFSSGSYMSMTIEQIKNLNVKSITAENAHLYLWTTCFFLPQAFGVLEAWGFRYVTLITLCKKRGGMGRYFQTNTEHILFGVKGKLATNYLLPNIILMPKKLQHSQKPEASYLLIEKVSPPPYLELFARRDRIGWDSWGNETVTTGIQL